MPEDVRATPPVVTVLLCVAFLFCAHQFAGFTAGSGVSPGVAAEHSSHSGSMGIAGGYAPATLEDLEAADEDPVNAENLTALLLVFFGMGLGLLFGGRRRRGAVALLPFGVRSSSVAHLLLPGPSPSRLSVFLL